MITLILIMMLNLDTHVFNTELPFQHADIKLLL